MYTKQQESVVREIKQDFEIVVRDNMPWLLRYIKSKLHNLVIAEALFLFMIGFVGALRFYLSVQILQRVIPLIA